MYEYASHDRAKQRGEQVDFDLYRYDTLTDEDIVTITRDTIERCDVLARAIVESEATTFVTTLGALHEIRDVMGLAQGKAGFMADVHPEKSVREAAKESKATLSRYSTDLIFKDDVYEKVKAFSETAEAGALTGEQARLLDETMRMYRRSGFELSATDRAKVQALEQQLNDSAIEFKHNVNADATTVLLNRDELAGMSQKYIDHLAVDETGSLRVTMAYPDIVPILEQAECRETRRKISESYQNRAAEANRPILEKIIAMRHEMATLLGYKSWAHYKLEERMAKNPDTVKAFYDQMLAPLTVKARDEIAVMTDMLLDDGYDTPLRRYDKTYYDTKLAKEQCHINPEEAAEYFPLPAVLDGMFQITGTVFGISYREVDIPTWHPDVLAYAIDDIETDEEIAQFYLDLHPREGKFSHAAATTLQAGRAMPDGSYRQPLSAVMANFTKPTANEDDVAEEPALLTHGEVKTLFHEFGHILHRSLTKVQLVNFSGSQTERDFVEAPSQINENWVWEPDILQRFARHYKTGEPIPTELVEGLVASRDLNVAHNTLGQIVLGMFDMRIHDESAHDDIGKIWEECSAISLLPFTEGTFSPASITHFISGYDAGYYGYLWSNVYGDDMYSKFKAAGLVSTEVGREYRQKILERGGTIDAIDMVRDFLGREPNSEAFMKKLGITAV